MLIVRIDGFLFKWHGGMSSGICNVRESCVRFENRIAINRSECASESTVIQKTKGISYDKLAKEMFPNRRYRNVQTNTFSTHVELLLQTSIRVTDSYYVRHLKIIINVISSNIRFPHRASSTLQHRLWISSNYALLWRCSDDNREIVLHLATPTDTFHDVVTWSDIWFGRDSTNIAHDIDDDNFLSSE